MVHMSDHVWTTDENDVRVWTHEGWTLKEWPWQHDLDITHSRLECEVDIDLDDGVLNVLGAERPGFAYATSDVPVTVPLPFVVLREILKYVDAERKRTPPGDSSGPL